MKKTFVILSLSMVCLLTRGQTIEHSSNSPRSGDRYSMRQLEYFTPGDEGRCVTWDFSKLVEIKEACPREYFMSQDSVLSGIDGEVLKSYNLTEDTLKCLGYDTKLMHMSYSEPMTLLTYPFSYGYTISNHFSGWGDYCKRLKVKSEGTLLVEADAEGVIVLAEGDTIGNVIRLHSTRFNSLSLHDQSDSLFSDTSRAKQEIEERYSWYARGYRYPLFETSSTCYYDNTNLVSCIQRAYSSNPHEQTAVNDSLNKRIQTEIAEDKARDTDIFHYSIQNNGSHITAEYSLDEDASICASVCNSRGIVFGRKSMRIAKGENHSMSFDVHSLPRGQYILYINVNGKIYNEKFNK